MSSAWPTTGGRPKSSRSPIVDRDLKPENILIVRISRTTARAGGATVPLEEAPDLAPRAGAFSGPLETDLPPVAVEGRDFISRAADALNAAHRARVTLTEQARCSARCWATYAGSLEERELTDARTGKRKRFKGAEAERRSGMGPERE